MYQYNQNISSKAFEQDAKHNWWLKKTHQRLQDANQKYLVFPIEWTSIPNAASYAVVILDYEASRVCGQPFVHWAACNIHQTHIGEGENLQNHNWIEGVNSSVLKTDDGQGVLFECIPPAFKANSFTAAIGYFPPMPPDKAHLYTIKVYGLNVAQLPLKPGFFLDALNNAMLDKIVGIHTFQFWSA